MEKQTFGVSQKAIIFNDEGKILTVRRSNTAPKRPGHWDLPGGILEMKEDLKEAIEREVKEETGLVLSNFTIMDGAQWHEDGNNWVTNCWMAKSDTDKVVLSYEHDDAK